MTIRSLVKVDLDTGLLGQMLEERHKQTRLTDKNIQILKIFNLSKLFIAHLVAGRH